MSWRALLVRLFVLVLPAQVLGVLLSGRVLTVSGLLRDHPGLASSLLSVGSGALAGFAVAMLVTPVRGRRAYVVVSGAFGLLSYLFLTVLSHVRLPEFVATPPWYTFVVGAVLVVGAQTLVALGGWAFRRRSAP